MPCGLHNWKANPSLFSKFNFPIKKVSSQIQKKEKAKRSDWFYEQWLRPALHDWAPCFLSSRCCSFQTKLCEVRVLFTGSCQGRVCQAGLVAASTSLSCFSLIIYLWQEVNTERRVGGREKRRSSLTFDTGWKRRSCAELGVCLLSAHLVSTEPLRNREEEHCSIQRQCLENREK